MERPTEKPLEFPVGPGVGQSPAEPLSIRELGALLVRHHGLIEGYFDVTIEFQLGVGSMGPNPAELYPSVIASVRRIGLKRVQDASGQGVIDAAALHDELSQSKPARKKRPARAKAP